MAWWEYPSNYSNGTSVSGIGDFIFEYPSVVLDNWWATGILLLMWVTIFGLSLVGKTEKALLTSSFITLVFAGYFYMAGVLNPVVPIVLIVFTIIGAIGSYQSGGGL